MFHWHFDTNRCRAQLGTGAQAANEIGQTMEAARKADRVLGELAAARIAVQRHDPSIGTAG